MGVGGLRACPDGLELFFPRPKGQFLVSECLPGWFLHFLAHFGNVKKTDEKIGSEKSATRCLIDRGRGGSKAIGPIPMETTHFKKGLP